MCFKLSLSKLEFVIRLTWFFGKSDISGIYIIIGKGRLERKENAFHINHTLLMSLTAKVISTAICFALHDIFGNISAYLKKTVSNLDFMVKHLGFFLSPLSCIYYIQLLLLQKMKINFVKTQEIKDNSMTQI